MELHFPNVEAAGIRPAHQGSDDQHRGNALGNGGGQSHTGHVHIQLGDEENVQDYVHNARNGQISQGALGVTGGPENVILALLFCVIVIPVMLYGYALILKYIRNRNKKDDQQNP